MGAQASKEELLYQQVSYGNVEGIRGLHRDGAGLEWVDKEGKTPLIMACMRTDFLHVAKALIELGANVNAYRPGSHAGTPLHHAAKRGLEQTVTLLLSHGANALVMNDDCQTALDLARAKGHINVVRAIESRICLFSGWLRELSGPGFLEALVPQLLSRKIWAVVLPCDRHNPTNPAKFELVMYPELQQIENGGEQVRCRRRRRRMVRRKVARPRTTISLWKVNIEEPNFNQPDPTLIILEKGSKTRYRLLSAQEGDKQQILSFYNACRGMPRLNIPYPATPAGAPVSKPLLLSASSSAAPVSAPTSAPEDIELAMAINASIQSALAQGVAPLSDVQPVPQLSNSNGWGSSSDNANQKGWGHAPKITNGWSNGSPSYAHNGWAVPESGPSASSSQIHEGQHNTAVVIPQLSNTNGWGSSSDNATHNGWGHEPSPSKSTNGWSNDLDKGAYNGWAVPGSGPSADTSQVHEGQHITPVTIPSSQDTPAISVPSAPSAPPIAEAFDDGPIYYPSIDSSPVDFTLPVLESRSGAQTSEVKEDGTSASSSCVICLDAPVEGACIPCGHMAGCMSCLNEIEANKWGCPVCRAKIDRVIKLYAV